jgi:hypothetical protein
MIAQVKMHVYQEVSTTMENFAMASAQLNAKKKRYIAQNHLNL